MQMFRKTKESGVNLGCVNLPKVIRCSIMLSWLEVPKKPFNIITVIAFYVKFHSLTFIYIYGWFISSFYFWKKKTHLSCLNDVKMLSKSWRFFLKIAHLVIYLRTNLQLSNGIVWDWRLESSLPFFRTFILIINWVD